MNQAQRENSPTKNVSRFLLSSQHLNKVKAYQMKQSISFKTCEKKLPETIKSTDKHKNFGKQSA